MTDESTSTPASAGSPPGAQRPGPRQAVSLQYLRFVASTMVVVLHASAGVRQAGYTTDPVFHLGNAGVDVFFVISGVVMAWIIGPLGSGDVPRFTRARVLRIVPLYWLATIGAALVLAGGENARGIVNLLKALVFIPIEVPDTDRFTSVYGPGWTLAYEVFFYALIGASLFLAARLRLPVVSAVLVGMVTLGLVVDVPGVLAFYTDQIVLEFAVGLFIGWSVTRTLRPMPRWVLIGVQVIGWILFVVLGSDPRDDLWSRAVQWGIPSAIVVGSALLLETHGGGLRRIPALVHLGDASYATYLTHLFTIRILGEIWDRVGLTDSAPAVVLMALVVVASVAVGSLVHVLVEEPLRRWLGARWRVGSPA